jgi:hypothetical protein
MLRRPSRALPWILSTMIASPALAQDTPPMDPNQLLQLFKQVKDVQVQQSRALRQKAYSEALAASQNPMRAAELWEQAIQATRFEGVSREGTAFREWKDKEGSGLRDREIQNALRLHFNWLALTLQKLNGAKNKELLPAVIQHAKDATAHQAMMEAFEERLKREKELASSGKHGDRDKGQKPNDDSIRQLNKQLVGEPVSGSVVARLLKLDETINDLAPRGPRGQQQQQGPNAWEQSAGNVDGIFDSIILPELRDQKDPRVLEYWDMRLKRATENISKSKLSFEIDRFNTITRPKLLWDRAQDAKLVGQRSRALTDMVNLIKTYPTHPDAANWISMVEVELMPQPAAASEDSPATGTSAVGTAPVATPVPATATPGVPISPRTP